jgi:hypothetical protein
MQLLLLLLLVVAVQLCLLHNCHATMNTPGSCTGIDFVVRKLLLVL